MNVKYEANAYVIQKQPYNSSKKDFQRGKADKNDKFRTHCKIKGQTTDQCFKLHGYPKWCKQKYRTKMAAQVSTQDMHKPNAVDSPLHPIEDHTKGHSNNVSPVIINAICQEILKALKAQQTYSTVANEQMSFICR